MCAESILSSVHTLIDTQDPFFKQQTFTDMLTHRGDSSSSLQLVCLKMLNAVLDRLPENDLARLLTSICSFVSHPNVACRFQMLLGLITVYDLYSADNFKITSATTLEIKRVCSSKT